MEDVCKFGVCCRGFQKVVRRNEIKTRTVYLYRRVLELAQIRVECLYGVKFGFRYPRVHHGRGLRKGLDEHPRTSVRIEGPVLALTLMIRTSASGNLVVEVMSGKRVFVNKNGLRWLDHINNQVNEPRIMSESNAYLTTMLSDRPSDVNTCALTCL